MINKEEIQNPLVHIFYQSLLEILGEAQALEVLKRQGLGLPSIDTTNLPSSIAEVFSNTGRQLTEEYGEMTARGLLIRSGRASLGFFRRHFSQLADLGSLENRLIPLERRFKKSLDVFAELWSKQTGLDSVVEITNRLEFTWQMKLAPENADQNLTPYFLFGLLEEFCAWLDARKSYRIVFPGPGPEGIVEIAIAVQSQD